MFRFEDPKYLYLLAVVLLLALVRYLTYRNQKKRLRKFGDPELVRQLMPLVSRWRPGVKFWLLEGALALLIVMMARPQFGKSISQKQRAGIETVIAIDVSNSMRAVDKDGDGMLSRLERAKMIVGKLIDQFTNDKIGLVVFAGDAFIQLPITNDFVSAKMFLNSIDPSMINNQGTDIAAAIRTSSLCFTQREHVGKAIIVITDGEDHEGAALEAAKKAHEEEGRNVYVLGIGSPKGSLVPMADGSGYMIDNTGQQVMSRLNEQMCAEVAQAGGGAYIHVENTAAAQKQLEEVLDKLEKAETSIYSEFDEQFQAVGLIALLLLILEVCILDRQNPTLRKLKLFKR
ncbi:MAG: VWA domain-containing protein [Prevotella sp.]|nr:VWA domain-containing protein [Prevotella sp.]